MIVVERRRGDDDSLMDKSKQAHVKRFASWYHLRRGLRYSALMAGRALPALKLWKDPSYACSCRIFPIKDRHF